jgi:transposase-like protein
MSGKINKNTQPQRREYDNEFKRQAVQMLVDGHSAASIVERLGISGTNLLYRW